MSESVRLCPRCGREIPGGMAVGPCPSCMLGRALGIVEDKPVEEPLKDAAPSAEVIEGYTLGEVIGEGGFGTVYRARQEHPVRREVALKVLKPGMDSKQVIARFEGERQALALMDHPGIAHVLDAGTTRVGRPFFAMDLVDGLPIDHYCEQNKLTLRERLSLFKRVCEAVHHAHQRGIIHRDLKPSNILVTDEGRGDPMPKVIDFGIAKATEHILSESTVLTVGPQLMGTPEYMSPEQALSGGGGIDTRADVYSLGAVLYVMLTGESPITQREFRDGGYQAILKAIAETEPARPSSRATTLQAPNSSIQAREISADLDWIVLKALAKERDRRYGSVEHFAEDIGNLLDNKPVTAHPPRMGYHIWKFVMRHRVGVAAAAVVLLALVAASVISTKMALSAERSAKVAQLRTYEAQETFSLADYRAAGAALEGKDAPLAIAHLARSLRTNPINSRMAAFKLATTLSLHRFPVPVGPPMSHGKEVVGCRFDPSGSRAITLCRDHFLRVWDVATGERLLEIPAILDRERVLPSSADGRLFATRFEVNKVLVWDTSTLKPLTGSLWHEQDITAMAIDPSGKTIAVGGELGTIHVWELPSGKKRCSLSHEGKIRSLLWHADGERLVSISSRRTARLWEVSKGESLADPLELPGPVFEINALSQDRLIVTTDGRRAGERGNRLAIYDLEDLSLVGQVQEMSDWVSDIAVHPGGRMLVTAHKGGVVQAWDLRDGSPGYVFNDKQPGYTGGVAFDPTGNRVAVTFEGGEIRVWDVRTGDDLTFQTASSFPLSCAWSPDGNVLLGCGSGEAWAWDLSDRRQQPTRMQHRRGLWHLTYNTAGDKVATAQFGGHFQTWDASKGTPDSDATPHGDTAQLVTRATPAKSLEAGLRGHVRFARSAGRGYTLLGEAAGRTRHLSVSPDGHWVARPAGRVVRVRDLCEGSEVFTSKEAKDSIRGVAFTKDSKHLAAVADGGLMRVWSTGDWQVQHEVIAFDVAARTIAVANDPLRVAVGTAWGGVFLWEPGMGEPRRFREDDHTEIVALRIDTSNDRLIVGTAEGVELVDLAEAKALAPTLPHDVNRRAAWPVLLDTRSADTLLTMDGRSAIAWDLGQSSPEPRRFGLAQPQTWALGVSGKLLACSSAESSALFDVTNGEALTPNVRWDYRIDTRNLPFPTACAISANERRFAIAADDGAVNQWDLPPMAEPTPSWLPDFAEALIGFALSERGERIQVTTLKLEEVMARLRALEGMSDWDQWGRWFASETVERAISPYSEISLNDYLGGFVESGRADLVRHALRLTPADRDIARRLLEIREESGEPDTSLHHEIGCLQALLSTSSPAPNRVTSAPEPQATAGLQISRDDSHIGLGALSYCPTREVLYLAQRLDSGGLFAVDKALDTDYLIGASRASALAISPDGNQLVYCEDYSGKIHSYDTTTGERVRLRSKFYAGDNDPMGVCFVPPGFENHPLVKPGEIIHVDFNVPSGDYARPSGPNRVFAWRASTPSEARTLYEGTDLKHVYDVTASQGQIWLADADYYGSQGGLYRLTEEGRPLRFTTSETIWPVALAFEESTKMLIASDRRGQRVVRIDPKDGSVEEIASGFVELAPCGLTTGEDGAIYVSDIGRATIYEIDHALSSQ